MPQVVILPFMGQAKQIGATIPPLSLLVNPMVGALALGIGVYNMALVWCFP